MFQMGATAVTFWFFEERVIELSTDANGAEAFERFIESFGPVAGPTFRKQMALTHYMEGLAAALIVIGMFLFGNFRAGHLFAAIGCAGFSGVFKVVVDIVSAYPQITNGNEAMVEHAPQGIMIFAGWAVANLVAFFLSNKPFFQSQDNCNKADDAKEE